MIEDSVPTYAIVPNGRIRVHILYPKYVHEHACSALVSRNYITLCLEP